MLLLDFLELNALSSDTKLFSKLCLRGFISFKTKIFLYILGFWPFFFKLKLETVPPQILTDRHHVLRTLRKISLSYDFFHRKKCQLKSVVLNRFFENFLTYANFSKLSGTFLKNRELIRIPCFLQNYS